VKILIIENNIQILRNIKKILNKEKFSVDFAVDGGQGLKLAKINDYDLLILDNFLPYKKAKDICRELRFFHKQMPILILSIFSDSQQKTELLKAGADDYLTKPFDNNEFVARIRALLRRPKELKGDIYRIDDLVLDSGRKVVVRGGKQIKLTKKEYMLLEYLLKYEGIILSRKMIMEHVWESDFDLFSNTVESHILSLRKKISCTNKKKIIHTISGMGYKISLP